MATTPIAPATQSNPGTRFKSFLWNVSVSIVAGYAAKIFTKWWVCQCRPQVSEYDAETLAKGVQVGFTGAMIGTDICLYRGDMVLVRK